MVFRTINRVPKPYCTRQRLDRILRFGQPKTAIRPGQNLPEAVRTATPLNIKKGPGILGRLLRSIGRKKRGGSIFPRRRRRYGFVSRPTAGMLAWKRRFWNMGRLVVN